MSTHWEGSINWGNSEEHGKRSTNAYGPQKNNGNNKGGKEVVIDESIKDYLLNFLDYQDSLFWEEDIQDKEERVEMWLKDSSFPSFQKESNGISNPSEMNVQRVRESTGRLRDKHKAKNSRSHKTVPFYVDETREPEVESEEESLNLGDFFTYLLLGVLVCIVLILFSLMIIKAFY